MKFHYEYRTSDNVRHKGEINAATRDAAFSLLREQGIRPGSVTEAPGVLNKVLGKGKRWMAIVTLALVSVILAVGLIESASKKRDVISLDNPTRHQILGESALIEKCVRDGWADVFESEGDRFLANFAIPGQQPIEISIDRKKLEEAIRVDVVMSNDDPVEYRQIKNIVNGMKSEARAYLAAGGSVVKYCERMRIRQEQEIGYYKRAENEILEAVRRREPASKIEDLWRRRNGELRQMGIRLVTMPEIDATDGENENEKS